MNRAQELNHKTEPSLLFYLQVGRPNPQLLLCKTNSVAASPEGLSVSGKSDTTKHDKVLFTNPSKLSWFSPKV